MSVHYRITPQEWVAALTSLLSTYPAHQVAAAAREALARSGRRELLPRIVAGLRATVREAQILVEVGQSLAPDDRTKLAAVLTTKFPGRPIVFKIAPELLGGIRIHYDATLVDCSGQEALSQLAAKLMEDL